MTRRDYNDTAMMAGLGYDAGLLRARLLVGYEYRKFQSRQYKALQAPVAEAALIWTPSGLTTLTGTLARRIQDASDETIAGYTETSAQLRVDHEYLRNVLLRANTGVSWDQFNQGGGQSDALHAGWQA